MRSSLGTLALPSSPETASTKSSTVRLAAPSFHDGSGSRTATGREQDDNSAPGASAAPASESEAVRREIIVSARATTQLSCTPPYDAAGEVKQQSGKPRANMVRVCPD